MWGSMYVKHVRPSRHVHGRWGSFGPIDVQGHYTHTHSTQHADRVFWQARPSSPFASPSAAYARHSPRVGYSNMNGLGVPVPRSERTEGQAETSPSELPIGRTMCGPLTPLSSHCPSRCAPAIDHRHSQRLCGAERRRSDFA